MNGIEVLILFGGSFIGGCITMFKMLEPKLQKPVKLRPLDLVQAAEIIKRLNTTVNHLQSVEDLLTTAQLCDEEHSQNIKCKWNSHSDNDGYIFSLSESKNHFVDLAEKERIKLSTSIVSDVDALCELRRNGVTKSVTQSHKKAERGAVNV